MKAVLVGTDLMYRKDGSLAPIEINTNVGWDETNRVEPLDEIWDLTDLVSYINSHNIEDIVFLPGTATKIKQKLQELLPEKTVRFSPVEEEDLENKLIIRTHYSDEALVDSFCRDKIGFLESIKSTSSACEYLLKTKTGFEGEITSVETGYPAGVPNFILKYRYPNYDKNTYPKLYRFNSMEELEAFANSEAMPEDFFLMPYYFCENKLWENRRIPLIREWSFFVANSGGSLDSVEIGRYTKLCGDFDLEKVGDWSGELDITYREMFLSTVWYQEPRPSEVALLDEGDQVWMADGTWKEIKDLKVGDLVKSLEIPAKEGFNLKNHVGNYGISVEELESSTKYIENEVTSIGTSRRFDDIVSFTFTDGTDWNDTAYSSYPTVNDAGEVEFKVLEDIAVGDRIVLVSIDNLESPEFVVKEISTITVERKLLESGYTVELNGSHLFISKRPEDLQAYAAIEHNDYSWGSCTEILLFDSQAPGTVTFTDGDDRQDGAKWSVLVTDLGTESIVVKVNNTNLISLDGSVHNRSCSYALVQDAYLKGETVGRIGDATVLASSSDNVIVVDNTGREIVRYSGPGYVGIYNRSVTKRSK